MRQTSVCLSQTEFFGQTHWYHFQSNPEHSKPRNHMRTGLGCNSDSTAASHTQCQKPERNWSLCPPQWTLDTGFATRVIQGNSVQGKCGVCFIFTFAYLCVEGREQPVRVRVFIQPCEFWELNSEHRAWQQVPLPVGHLAVPLCYS